MPKGKNQSDAVENENALKHYFNKELLGRIALSISKVYPAFDRKEFLALEIPLKSLEMKPRVQRIRDELRRQLPAKYPDALKILLRSVEEGKVNGFDLWPYTEFVQTYGLEDLEISLDALKIMTRKFTAEWAVRPFIEKHPKAAMKYLLKCAGDKDVHVRRWASEGSRPRLPWGLRLQEFVKDPTPTDGILEMLKFDSELYVRKSVSNHLNDIAKDHPLKVIKTLKAWKKSAGETHADKIEWIIHRSLRSLIKAGHPGALQLIGVSGKAKVEFSKFKLGNKKIKMGERLDFGFQLQSLSGKSQKLVIDYIIHFVKANQKTAPKVFKLKAFHLDAKQALQVSKSHPIKPITTRAYYAGKHYLEIQINGVSAGKHEWILELK